MRAVNERAPDVNQLKVRENGPYALHAAIVIDGAADGFRATLCRCGGSRRKPWCDGSHVAGGFIATGEPSSGATAALAARGGPVRVTPTAHGPLKVHGNLEICSGTGGAVARTEETMLCRCGNSNNKPFCDGSHRAARFVAAGA
jgi:CDGSH-type Zn-finger protein